MLPESGPEYTPEPTSPDTERHDSPKESDSHKDNSQEDLKGVVLQNTSITDSKDDEDPLKGLAEKVNGERQDNQPPSPTKGQSLTRPKSQPNEEVLTPLPSEPRPKPNVPIPAEDKFVQTPTPSETNADSLPPEETQGQILIDNTVEPPAQPIETESAADTPPLEQKGGGFFAGVRKLFTREEKGPAPSHAPPAESEAATPRWNFSDTKPGSEPDTTPPADINVETPEAVDETQPPSNLPDTTEDDTTTSRESENNGAPIEITEDEIKGPEIPQEKIDDIRKQLEAGDTKKGGSGRLFFNEDQILKYKHYSPENTETPFVFEDQENKQLVSYSREFTNRIIEADLAREAKGIADETEKLPNQLKVAAGRGLEQVSKGAHALIEKATENKVSNFFLEQGNAFLNKFNWTDKEKGYWAAGIAVGAGSNVALTAFAPFLAFGPGRLVRSAAFSGVLLGVSKGANVFRHMSMNKVLSEYSITNKTERQDYTKQFDNAFKLLGKGAEGDYQETMKKLSTEIFSKYGKASNKSDLEGSLGQASEEELQKRIESLSTKYQKLNNNIRSFAAGLSVGTISSTGFFALDGALGIVDKMKENAPKVAENLWEAGKSTVNTAKNLVGKPFEGDIHVAAPSVTPTPISEGTPAPTAIPEETTAPTPGPGEIPGSEVTITPETLGLHDIVSNPDYSHTLEIQQGDTVGSLLSNNGYDIDWGPDNASVFGAHLQANYDMLHTMHDNVAATGISVEDFPTQAEISTLVQQASAGDAVAMHRLTESLHWIPAGGGFNVLTPEAVELINNSQGG